MTKARDTANLTGSGVGLSLLDIDAGTDIGAALVDADLMIVDDGAGGTNRKATMSRLATYMGTKIGGGLEFIASLDASSSATLSFTGFDPSKYDSYLFTFHSIVPANDDVDFQFITSSDTSSHSYDSGSTDYIDLHVVNGAIGNLAQRANGRIFPSIGTGSGEIGFWGSCEILAAHLAKRTFIISNAWGYHYSGNLYHYQRVGYRDEDAQVNAIRFFMESGNIASGTITMYGMVNS